MDVLFTNEMISQARANLWSEISVQNKIFSLKHILILRTDIQRTGYFRYIIIVYDAFINFLILF